MTKSIQLKPGIPRDTCLQSNREPLYKRLPKNDENGKFLSDFMLLIPGLRNLSAASLQSRLAILHGLLDKHPDVVFADLNTPLNLLWVSVRARHGVIADVSAEIRQRFPEARLVGHTVSLDPPRAESRTSTTARIADRTRQNRLQRLLGHAADYFRRR